MESQPPLSAAYFDAWYADMDRSPVKDQIQRRHLHLPPHLSSTSSLTGDGLDEVCAALRLLPGNVLLDLACGRGGYGLEIATRTRSRLIGIDFSPEAVRQAARKARDLSVAADFRVGDLVGTGLGSASVDAVMCVDSIQFADGPAEAFAEIRRVLAPGGPVVLTCWEPVERGDERLVSRLRDVDLDAGLRAAGFEEIAVAERPGWRAAELGMWKEAAALDPGDDPALLSFHTEALRVLETAHLLRRVMAVANAP